MSIQARTWIAENRKIGRKIGDRTRFLAKLNLPTKSCAQRIDPTLNPLSQDSDHTRFHTHSDHLGSINVLTDHCGDVIEHTEQLPYGLNWKQDNSTDLNSNSHATAAGQNNAAQEYGFTGKPEDAESNLIYYGARYYDPRAAVWLSPDPALEKYLDGQGGMGQSGVYSPVNLSLYTQSSNNPISYKDPDGREAYAVNGRINILPDDISVPMLSIPNKIGAKGFCRCNPLSHAYNVFTPTNISFAAGKDSIGDSIREIPALGKATAASAAGTRNDVGPLAPLEFIDSGDNFVNSYTIPSPNKEKYTDIVVNYTIAGEHIGEEGFVAKFGEKASDGSVILRSYGEGNSPGKAKILDWYTGPKTDEYWQTNHQLIIDSAVKKMETTR